MVGLVGADGVVGPVWHGGVIGLEDGRVITAAAALRDRRSEKTVAPMGVTHIEHRL
ncbi:MULTISPECIES: hypothetical protein [unclassified Halorubrum]|uniref:hypothetical protein n=1 Tax=unclassified Halorubrum TaxID=2642239 RepID=UPI0015953A95|nr:MULTISPECIES: hypothetical protein [unclassified Halorubrum]